MNDLNVDRRDYNNMTADDARALLAANRGAYRSAEILVNVEQERCAEAVAHVAMKVEGGRESGTPSWADIDEIYDAIRQIKSTPPEPTDSVASTGE